MVKYGIKETLEVLELAGSVVNLGKGLMDGVGLGDLGLAKELVEDIAPAIDNVELVWKHELRDLDEGEVEQIKNKVKEVVGDLLVIEDDWFEFGTRIIMAVVTLVRLIKLK